MLSSSNERKMDDVCPKCNGAKHIRTVKKDFLGYPSEFYIPCSCLINEKFQQKLGHKIFDQRNLKKSKLINQINTNLFIHGSEEKFLPHLKHVIMKQDLSFPFSTMDDSQYLRIYLGNDPDIKDVASWQKPFLVFFMGHVGYKNKALPGMIVELINVRLLKGYITWIHYPDRFWGSSCIEYSEEFEELRKKHFITVDMRSAQAKTQTETQAEKTQMDDKIIGNFG